MIVWLENPKQWPYLRKTPYWRCRRNPKWSKGTKLFIANFYKLVGYENEPKLIATDGKYRCYAYTVYWLKTYDAGCPDGDSVYNKGGQPHEAVLVEDLVGEN